jgi:hypothetical protein
MIDVPEMYCILKKIIYLNENSLLKIKYSATVIKRVFVFRLSQG